jgi:predicted amidophosphoribosyltransferase
MLGCVAELSTRLYDWVNTCRNMLFPPVCVFCRQPLAGQAGCCGECSAEIRIWPHNHCRQCGRVMPENLTPGPCGRCLRRVPPQLMTESLFIYRPGPVRDAILEWKLQGRDAGIHWLLDAATPRLQSLFARGSLLLPVPMPLSRMRRAGRHHAADLCRTIAERTGASFDWRLLRRSGTQQRQSALSGRARRKNLCKAFHIDEDYKGGVMAELNDENTPCPRVWVVDDIITTGATMHYACQALKHAGIRAGAFSLTRLPSKE